MRQVTLVALYGNRPHALNALISQCQEAVGSVPGVSFAPYDLRQIHGTIIGLERAVAPGNINANFAKYRGRDVEMDFDGFLDYLRGSGCLPFEVQIGGFAERDYPFTSDDPSTRTKLRPYERSFSVHGGKVVLMGWPVRDGTYQSTLNAIRNAAQRFGILHGYHREPEDVDNDLFFRIGMIDPGTLAPGAKATLERDVRLALSRQEPLIVKMGRDDIFIAAYEDNRLPFDSTRAWSLADSTVTGDFVAELFGVGLTRTDMDRHRGS